MSYSPQYTRNQDIDRNLIAISSAFREADRRFLGSPFVILRDVVINTTDTPINHGLRYVPTGAFPVKQDANATIWVTDSGPSQVTMRASAQVTVTLLVF